MAITNSIIFLRRPKKTLSILGVWLPPDCSTFNKIYTVLIMTLLSSFFVFNLIYMAVSCEDLEAFSVAAYLLFAQVTLCCKSTAFIVNKRNVKELLLLMDSKVFAPQSEIHIEILVKNSNTIKNLYTCLVACAMTTSVGWTLTPILDNNERGFPYDIWLPLNADKSPVYEVGYIYQILAIFYGAAIYVTVDVITVGMIMFGCAQLDIIRAKTQQISSVPWSSKLNPEEWKKLINDNNQLLIECIGHHQDVIRFIDQVDSTFHINIVFQVCGTVIIICMIIFRISVEPLNAVRFYSSIIYLVTILFLLLVYCWFGNELTKRNEDLRDSLYQCPWYEQDMKFRKVLLIAMECTKRPIIFKAGHCIPLSRPTFVSILRCSYSYFAVLNQVKNG